MAVNKCKTISNSQIQNYQLVVIHNCRHIIHKTNLRWPCLIGEIHTDVERRSWKILFDQ